MSRVGLGTLLVLLTAGCSGPYACGGASSDALGPDIQSERVEGSFRAVNAGDAQAVRLRVTLTGLPELWGDDVIAAGTLGVSLSIAYDAPPFGGDGRTEMPRFRIARSVPNSAVGVTSGTTGSFPGPLPQITNLAEITTCVGEERESCCVYGSRECSFDVGMSVERVDGAPFPPVSVGFGVQGNARVQGCPLARETTRLSLVKVDP